MSNETSESERHNLSTQTWRERAQKSCEAFLHLEQPTKDDLIKLLWNTTIDRIAPQNPEERSQRKAEDKFVWEGDLEDPHLLQLLLYSAKYSAIAIQKNYTWKYTVDNMMAGASDQISRIQEKAYAKLHALYPQTEDIYKDLAQYAQDKLSTSVGEVKNIHPLPIDSIGSCQGVTFQISGYTPEGHLRIEGRNRQEHAALYDIAEHSIIEPWKVTPVE